MAVVIVATVMANEIAPACFGDNDDFDAVDVLSVRLVHGGAGNGPDVVTSCVFSVAS